MDLPRGKIMNHLHVHGQAMILKTIVLILGLIGTTSGSAAKDSRPFWTEKSAFIEGSDLFVVGVASHARSVEEGRKQAFEHGKTELMNYAQVTSLEAYGLVIETQMTYEEQNTDGTVTVFRLLRVPADKLVDIQGRLQAQSQLQEQTLDKARRDLMAAQDSVLRKQKELETRAKDIETAVITVSRLQVTLGEKAVKIEEQQKQVEQLLQQLSTRVSADVKRSGSSPATGQQVTTPDSLLKTLQEAEAQLDAQAEQLRGIHQRAIERIKKERSKIQARCQYLELGMTKVEVLDIMGKPDSLLDIAPRGRERYETGGSPMWYYGNRKDLELEFHSAGGLTAVSGCETKRFTR
jgi:hypothetical protein